MKKTTVAVVFLAMALLMTFAVVQVDARKPEVIYDSFLHFTQTRGTLGGADYELLMPDNWNEKIVIGLRGYEGPVMPPMSDTYWEHGVAMAFVANPSNPPRFAFAWSTYGEGGWCIDAAMIRTHQLTEYVVENYNVQGEVFLLAFSMGGDIGCMLAEKYPELYDGVLDVCGVKDMKSSWSPGFVDMEIECGGTPETKPQAYERRSATYHAGITIPVISIIGELDPLVPIAQFDMYYDAVEAAGCLNYYRSYIITGGHHLDGPIQAAISPLFMTLVKWVVNGIVPDPTPPPIP